MRDVTVWFLDPLRVKSEGWLSLLSVDERARSERFRFAEDRASYLAAHGLLRSALSQLVPEVPASRWSFALGEHGKPWLPSHPSLHFNLSHCRQLVAVAIGAEPLGVDVEPLDAAHATDDVAQRVYGPAELAHLAASRDAAERVERFFTQWVLKEAWVKATGVGLHDDLPSFQLEGLRVLSGEARWQFQQWTPVPRVKMGLCVERTSPLNVVPEEWPS